MDLYKNRRAQQAILGVAVVLYFSLTVLTVRTYRPWVDEAWAGTPAWSLVARGFTGTPSFDASAYGEHGLKRLDRITYWIPPLYVAIQAWWYRIVPFSLESMRALSVLAGLIALISWYIIVKRLTGEAATATLLFLLMSCDYFADTASSFGRADAMSCAFQAAAYASYLVLREKRFALAILVSQLFVVASGLTHPNGGVLAFFGQLFLTLLFDRGRLGWKHVALAAVPYAVGGLAWGAYILQDPSAFISQYSFQTSMRFFGILKPLSALRREAQRYLEMMGLAAHSAGSVGPHFLKALIFVAYAVGALGVLIVRSLRESPAGKALLGLLAVYLFYYTFLEATKAGYYFIYLGYVYTALLALWLSWCWRQRKVPRVLLVLAVLGMSMLQCGGLLVRARLNHYKNGYMAAVQFLRAHAGPNDLIVGSHELGFALGFQEHFLDDYRIGLGTGRYPDYIVVEEIYENRFAMLRNQRPHEYLQLEELLKQYHEVYNHDHYRILTRKEMS
jgi:hypothetical protein